jgi:hypothetical protein
MPRNKGVPGLLIYRQSDLAAAFTAARTPGHARKRSATEMGADIGLQTESPARTYERPALRKAFAAFAADSKVA